MRKLNMALRISKEFWLTDQSFYNRGFQKRRYNIIKQLTS